ncbi:MAG: hypothetical protein ACI957_003789, partial [Verrucomicrobiales bacterium]
QPARDTITSLTTFISDSCRPKLKKYSSKSHPY